MNKNTSIKKITIQLYLILFIVLLLISGCAQLQTDELKHASVININHNNFVATDGSYSIFNTQRETFNAIIRLNQPAPEDFFVLYNVKENVAWARDRNLGFFRVDFIEGSTEAITRFWLECTPTKTIRGNDSSSKGKQALVYLEWSDIVGGRELNHWVLDYTARRQEHLVSCKTSGTGTPPPPKNCATRSDCLAGQWCISGKCKPPPYSQACTPRKGCGDTGLCVAVRNNPTKPGGIELLGRCSLEHMNSPQTIECMCLIY